MRFQELFFITKEGNQRRPKRKRENERELSGRGVIQGKEEEKTRRRTTGKLREIALPRDLALDEAIGAGLGGVHLGILASVLVALVPA